MDGKLIALFSREQDLEKIKSIFTESFRLKTPLEGNNFHLENSTQVIDIGIYTNSMEEEVRQFIEKQKNAVSGYFSHIQDCDEDIKINLIHHIRLSDTFIPLTISSKISEENISEYIDIAISIMLNVMEQMDGVLITDDGVTALDSEGNVILSENEDSDLDFYFPFEYKETPEFLNDCTDKQVTRRNENMKYLFDKKIYVCELPLNDDDDNIRLRSKEEVVRRTLGTLLVSLYSEALLNPNEKMSVSEARDFIGNVMKDLSINKMEDVLTEKELKYIRDDNSDESTRIQYSWNYENLYVLEWILGLEEWNYPDDICNAGKIVRNLKQFHSINDMCSNTSMRSKKEILDKADLIYRMDWAAVDARIHGMQGPARLQHGVVQEWHKTLNWMICFDDAEWDDVTTPT